MSGVRFTGDFGKLAALAKQMRTLASPATRQSLARVVGAAAVTEAQLGFRDGVDPYGAPWAPLAWRAGRPLLDTGRLRSSFTANPTPTGFELGTNVGYSVFHQYGARVRRRTSRGKSRARVGRIPQRQMVPEGTLGARWSRAFEDTATRFFSRIFKG